jgi:hypothetical protein
MAKINSIRGFGAFGNGLHNQIGAILFTLPLVYLIFGVCLTIPARAAQGDDARAVKGTERSKVAEGEYAIYEEGNGGAFGPFGEEVYDFHESWTLWRTPKGRYEIEGERKFMSPLDVEHKNRFSAELSRDLTALRVTEFAPLKWRPDSGPVSCEFLPKELHCFSEAKDPKQSVNLRVPMDHPFALLWPVSPFSLSGLTRETERELGHGTEVQLLSVEQPDRYDPVRPTILTGQLQYLGEENIQAADQNWTAHKFSLKVPSYPQFLIWTSSKGILLALAIEHAHPNWPQEGMKLTRFKTWLAGFGPE